MYFLMANHGKKIIAPVAEVIAYGTAVKFK
jgi:hypothetical protein